jgi:hypothetical protein
LAKQKKVNIYVDRQFTKYRSFLGTLARGFFLQYCEVYGKDFEEIKASYTATFGVSFDENQPKKLCSKI